MSEGTKKNSGSEKKIVKSSENLSKAAYLEGRSRGVIRLSFLPKAANLEGRCRGVVRLRFMPKAAYLEGRRFGARVDFMFPCVGDMDEV